MSTQPSVVFFLGAGASADATPNGPIVTATLLNTALKTAWLTERENLAQERVRILAESLRVSESAPYPTVDDVLALCDWSAARGLSLTPHCTASLLNGIHDDIGLLIHATVARFLHEPYRDAGARGSMGSLADFLIAQESGRCAVVSLNWDCLLELSLSCRIGSREPQVDYGFSYLDGKGAPVASASNALAILRPHGSLSWLACHLCGRVYSTLSAPELLSMGTRCHQCHDCLHAVIIPPSPPPTHVPRVLELVAARVEQALSNASTLVILGYSLPPQDTDIRAALVRGLAMRGARPKLRVIIVDLYDQEKPSVFPELVARYQSLLGPSAHIAPPKKFTGGIAQWIQEGGLTEVAK